ncbi:serine/threonine-protein kinase HipA [Lachnospiraceae bacterium NE2001]|nr:serine/threonine-protein kinase HipA [Lachnospiraceae bacterium NE2001]
MRELAVFLEIQGSICHIGDITGEDYRVAEFKYLDDYLRLNERKALSISMPLSETPFSSERTRSFFEGLLPEGFSRTAVANWIKVDDNDYLTILSSLGRECLGAVKIVEKDTDNNISPRMGYKILSIPQVKKLAAEGATKSTEILVKTHLSLTGASGKVGLYYDDKKRKWYLPEGDAPSTHIVKQSHVRLSQIVFNEQLSQLTAKNLGIDVPESFIVNTGEGSDGEILFATKRYDRVLNTGKFIDKFQIPERLHQEDFAQAMGIPSSEKYEKENSGYMGRMFDLVRGNVSDPIAEELKLWKLICFNFLIGNTDAHIKNYSLLYSDDMKRITLAPAYDIVCTRAYNLTNEMSLYIGNEIDIDRINRSTFVTASKEVGISERIALKIFDEVADGFEKAINDAAETIAESGFENIKSLKTKIKKSSGYRNLK